MLSCHLWDSTLVAQCYHLLSWLMVCWPPHQTLVFQGIKSCDLFLSYMHAQPPGLSVYAKKLVKVNGVKLNFSKIRG